MSLIECFEIMVNVTDRVFRFFFTIHFPIWAYVKTFSSGSGHLGFQIDTNNS
jgi:hypothetical protein